MRGSGHAQQGSSDGDVEVLPLRPVLVLSEEELLVLTDGDLGVVPARIGVPTEPEADVLLRTVVTRSLMARGLILPSGGGERAPSAAPCPEPEPGARGGDAVDWEAAEWEATEPLGLTLSLRAMAPVVLALHRVLGLPAPRDGQGPSGRSTPEAASTASGSTIATRYLHLHRELAVIEDVTPHGMHGLLTVFPDRYPEAVTDFIVPPGAVAGTGAVRTLGSDTDDPGVGPVSRLMADLGHPRVLVEVDLVRVDRAAGRWHQSAQLMLALGEGGCFRAEDSRSYHPVDPGSMVAELLARALALAP
ncbi:MAG: hypothetical protein GX555_02955 [Actinomycetales bacterium]|nr:hypothetical protein [Actinomycetales bacterium]